MTETNNEKNDVNLHNENVTKEGAIVYSTSSLNLEAAAREAALEDGLIIDSTYDKHTGDLLKAKKAGFKRAAEPTDD